MSEQEKTIKRLRQLSAMLSKYAHRWGETPSGRMLDWVDEYEDIRRNQPEVFRAYCEQTGFHYPHDAYDCMA